MKVSLLRFEHPSSDVLLAGVAAIGCSRNRRCSLHRSGGNEEIEKVDILVFACLANAQQNKEVAKPFLRGFSEDTRRSDANAERKATAAWPRDFYELEAKK
jgi:hypothetical protein